MSTVTLSPQQKAANTRKRNKFLAELKAKQDLFRNNPQALAAEIAKRIREDEHANENAENYDNGQMHWYQSSWGQFKFDSKLLKKTTIGRSITPVFEVKCPTTACIAGTATTLAGYPMVLSDLAIEDAEDGDVIDISECIVNGRRESIVDIARGLFGFSFGSWKSSWLFDAYRSKEQVLWALDLMAAGEQFNPEEAPGDPNDE